jgi:sugar phosphate isomerase/epimerase
LQAARAETNSSWTIGCLNRPWVKWSVTEMLDGVKAAGYRVLGLQTPTAMDPFVGKEASAAYLADLKAKIAARGLHATLGRLRSQEMLPHAEAAAEIRTQLNNAKTLGLTAVINTGTGKTEHYEAWYRTMAFAAAYAADHGIQVVIKPHGGVTAGAAELLTCLEKIKHPNLRLWYDAGNIIHYTGKDPLRELEPIVSHVTTFTAKDCADKNGEVMIQFGTGRVDFAGIFRRLKTAGFRGPIMVESCQVGATAAETTANAKANREFLERTLATV